MRPKEVNLYQYEVYDNEDYLVFIGTSDEIKKNFGLKGKAHISRYVNHADKIQGKYSVYSTDSPSLKDVVCEEERKMRWLCKALDEFGNTIIRTDPDSFIAKLKDKGYQFKVREVFDRLDKARFWVLEKQG